MTLNTPKLHRFIQGKGQLLLAFFLPFALFLLICAFLNVTPFGAKNLFIQDMHNQYVDYFSYLKSIVFGSNDFFYTYSMCLGGEMVGFSAYYLLSPFNVLFLLFDNADYSLCVTLVIGLKIGTAGLTAALFLRRFGKRTELLPLFSAGYGLMAYVILYASNVMWLDGLVLLPLVALGIEWILDRKSFLLYSLSLFYALFTNYYIGYMLCIFAVLWVVVRLLSRGEGFGNGCRVLVRFGAASLLAGALCAFLLIPVFLSLQGTKAGFRLDMLTMERNFSLVDFTDRLFFGNMKLGDMAAYESLQYNSRGLPSLWCGTVCMLAGWMYFFNSSVSLRERLMTVGLLLVLLLSCWLNALNLVWHGLNHPVYFPYRYSFLISFVIIFCAWRCMSELSGMRWGAYVVSCSLVLWLLMLAAAARGTSTMEVQDVLANGLLLVMGAAAVWLLLRRDDSRAAVWVLTAVQLLSLTLGGLDMGGFNLKQREAYRGYVQRTEPLIHYVEQKDEGFFRMEKTFSRTANDAMQFSYNGMTHFSSSQKLSAKILAGSLGYYSGLEYADYGRGSTMAMDSFLGVKYLLSESFACVRPYEPFGASEDVAVFRNPYAMELCFAADPACLTAQPDAVSMFERQNDMFAAVSGLSDPIFTKIDSVSAAYENIDALEAGAVTRFERVDNEKDAFVTYTVEPGGEGLVYMHLSSPVTRSAELWLNGECIGSYFNSYGGDIVCLGRASSGQPLEVRLKLNEESVTIVSTEFFVESEAALQRQVQTIGSHSADVEKITSSHIRWTGNMTEDRSCLLFTVPFDANWLATVDGEKAETAEVLGGFLCVQAGPGEHVIELRYVPAGLTAGLSISGAALLLGLLWFILDRRKSERK